MNLAQRTPLNNALKACRPAFIATAVMSIFINLTMLALPLYSVQVYDRVLTSRNAGTLAMLSLIVLVFLILYGALEYVRSGLQLKASILFDEHLRRDLFDALLRAQAAGIPTSGSMALRDADQLRDGISGGLIGIFCDVPWAPIFVGLCFLLHPLLGFVALAGAVFLFSFAIISEYVTRAGMRRAGQLAAEASSFAASALKNGEAVRGLGMGDTVGDRWEDTQAEAVATQASTTERSSAMVAVSKFVRMLVQTGLLCAGAYLAIEQLISPGVMMASSILMGRALAPVEQLVAQWRRLIALRASYARVQHVFRSVPVEERPTSLGTPVGRLDVENLVVLPPSGGRPVVKGVGFSVEPGEVVAIVGASGSGKSSLVRAISGVWPTMQGAVRVDGADLRQWERNRLGKHVGYLPQSVELFGGTIAQNIARLSKVDDSEVVAAAKAAGAHEVILRLPKGYDTQIGEGGAALSGGTRQRVGLARALFGNPSLIVLDEPNANLDEDGERALASALAALKAAKKSVLVVSHRPSILQHVDKILVMSFGMMLSYGPRDTVLANMRGQRMTVAASNDRPAAARGGPAPAASGPVPVRSTSA